MKKNTISNPFDLPSQLEMNHLRWNKQQLLCILLQPTALHLVEWRGSLNTQLFPRSLLISCIHTFVSLAFMLAGRLDSLIHDHKLVNMEMSFLLWIFLNWFTALCSLDNNKGKNINMLVTRNWLHLYFWERLTQWMSLRCGKNKGSSSYYRRLDKLSEVQFTVLL